MPDGYLYLSLLSFYSMNKWNDFVVMEMDSKQQQMHNTGSEMDIVALFLRITRREDAVVQYVLISKHFL